MASSAHDPGGAPPSRDDYVHHRVLDTRWRDNDVYGHVNNVVYYSWFDTVVNDWMIDHGLDIHGDVVGFVVSSGCDYYAPVAFPDPVELGLRVGRLGRSSVVWELGVFAADRIEPVATGRFVHVFVDRSTGKPVPVPHPLRPGIEGLVAD
ncbi:acyl-CoA thioesterase [Salsipaludibacter albus]|uniref:acyl-CoA thioesterase n=1 Tax=Salsipaludibacter albus TaxID=2849650 RepID=UPI001EE41B5C|nr:acyl-CoA thioesterase [Salsipaludibacter albus]